MIAGWIDTAALYIGRIILGMFGAVFVLMLISELIGSLVPDVDDTDYGKDEADTSKTVNDIIKEDLDEPERFTEIDYSPNASVSWDWSIGETISRDELANLKSDLESAGYFVHPFPRDPDGGILNEEWHWGRKNMGLWTEEPMFYAVAEDGERVQVTPDLSGWEVETRTEMVSTGKKYGYRDQWERENVA